ncbi:MAG: Ala-tRNA(Pro) deacylase [Parasphingorhabdus sp.]
MSHWTPDRLLKWLSEQDISCPTINHPPLRTVEDSRAHREIAEGAYTKNLFVRNKKGRMWLLTMLESRQIHLKQFAKTLGAGNFSFASEERLMKHLGIIPGAVSPLALINDSACEVNFVLDEDILQHAVVHFHPLDNCMTTTLKKDDFLRFLTEVKHVPHVVTFPDQ